jgi:hypothetical protein
MVSPPHPKRHHKHHAAAAACLQVEQNGTYVQLPDVDKSTKGNRWKAAYITSRTPLYLKQWMAADKQAV